MRFDTKTKVYTGVFVTSALSVVLSVLVTLLIKGGEFSASAILTSIIVPLCVAPAVSFWGFLQAYKIEQLNTQLSYLVNHDALTNLRSRSYFFEQAKSDKTPGSAITLMIDADHFKNVNDTFGHDIGDEALRHFSNLIRKNCRETDTVARLGGEEFGVYMPNTDLSTAQIIAERIRTEIFRTPLRVGGREVQLSVSIGLARRLDNEGFTDVFKRADNALYRAKANGRNRVCLELENGIDVTSQTAAGAIC